MSVAVVIPTWNRNDLLRTVLDSIRHQTLVPVEIVVVDNGSVEDPAAITEAAGARLIRMGHNAGFAPAVNAGIRAVTAQWVVVLNNDVTLSPDWLRALYDAATASEAWFATGKLLSAADPGCIDGTYDLISRAACAWRAGHGSPDGPLWNQSQEIVSAPFTAALFRRNLFERIGYLDERFESYLEDVDFGLRCALAGCRGRYVPAAVAWHQGSATLGAWGRETARRIARNQIWLVAKHYPRGWFWNCGWPVLVGQVLWVLVAFRHGAGMAAVRGKWQGLMTFQQTRASVGKMDGGNGLARYLQDSEQHLRHLQQQTAFERYWRWYFRLT